MSTFSSNKLSKSIVVSACSSNVPWGQEGSDRSSCVADKTWSHSKIWTYFVFIWICFKTYIVLWFSCEKGSEKKEKYHAFIKILVINCKNWVSGCRSPDPLILLDMGFPNLFARWVCLLAQFAFFPNLFTCSVWVLVQFVCLLSLVACSICLLAQFVCLLDLFACRVCLLSVCACWI